LDLTLARTFSGPLKMQTHVATKEYMPPEQCEYGEVTPQSDLFSLGATQYEGVSRMRPFPEGDDESELRADQYPQIEYDALPLSEGHRRAT
jgi:serine/threonine protein kinase